MHLRNTLSAALLFTAGTIVGPTIAPYVQAQETPTPIVTIPNRRYNQGTETFGPVAVPAGMTQISVVATRVSWPVVAGNILEILTQVSFDGGNTWRDWSVFAATGGTLFKRDGSVATTSTMEVDLPDAANTMRQVRGVITINRALDSAISVTVR